MPSLQEQFGEIDIYLFDQLLRGRIHPGMKILDAGCGGGRNLVYLLRQDFDVSGVDQDREAIQEVRRVARYLAPKSPAEKFKLGTLESLPGGAASFDFVICNAVLHFATSDRQFLAMLHGIWQVLKPGGILFCRLASSIGIEPLVKPIAGRRYLLPDGSERYLVDAALLEKLTRELKAELVDPIKTTLVQNQRSMTTWVIRKLETH
jgi:tellurite methyltransferase